MQKAVPHSQNGVLMQNVSEYNGNSYNQHGDTVDNEIKGKTMVTMLR